VTILVFSIGPVQGFVAQSRRTADGWVGSFLLSYLAGKALLALEAHAEEIVEPHRESSGTGDPTVAGIPNTLVARLRDDVAPGTAGRSACKAVADAWNEVADAVREDMGPASMVGHAAGIWRRQTEVFWETYWAWGPDSSEAYRELAMRKRLRDFAQIEERGERCSLCGEREALWDECRPSEKAGQALRRYWAERADEWSERGWSPSLLRAGRRSSGSSSSPVYREPLCAICLIKRLVPHTENPVRRQWVKSPTSFPSTSTVATARAKAKLVHHAWGPDQDKKLSELAEDFVKAVPRVGDHVDPKAFSSWKEALEEGGLGERAATASAFLRLDGRWLLYGETVRNEAGLDDEKHQGVARAHQALVRFLRAGGDKFLDCVPPSYWAVLVMDGDRMGAFKRAFPNRTTEISKLLNGFATTRVPVVVREGDGRLVYAGGDDILAFLPVATALDAAENLRSEFAALFKSWTPGQAEPGATTPTLSGAIVFAHHQAPLATVLSTAHRLLEEEAKTAAGRNAVAIQVRARGGPSLTFATRWENGEGHSWAASMAGLVKMIKERELAKRMLQQVGEQARVLELMAEEKRRRFARTIVSGTRLPTAVSPEDAADAMLAVAAPEPTAKVRPEALVLARFLANEGREVP
jgi:CRISPR-associated protein Cmr2